MFKLLCVFKVSHRPVFGTHDAEFASDVEPVARWMPTICISKLYPFVKSEKSCLASPVLTLKVSPRFEG
jgi:hypothetical protein